MTRVDEELIEFEPVVEGTARLHLRRSFRPRGGKQRDDVLTRLSFCICIGHATRMMHKPNLKALPLS